MEPYSLNNTTLVTKEYFEELKRKEKAFDEIKKYVDKEVDFYMDLYRETKDPAYSLLNSHYDSLLGYIEELEDDLDER